MVMSIAGKILDKNVVMQNILLVSKKYFSKQNVIS